MEQTEIKNISMGNPEGLIKKQNASADCSDKETSISAQMCHHSKEIMAERINNEKSEIRYVYSLGKIKWRFPSLAIEKEFAQVTGRMETTGLTDWQAFHSVLAQKENRYLVRQMCWVMSIGGLETYILHPRHPAVSEFDSLLETIPIEPSHDIMSVVIGVKGPIAPQAMCNGLMLPIVAFDQIYTFDVKSLIESIPCPENLTAEEFKPAACELLDRVMLMADNAGATDEDRALNYLAVRYKAVYAKTAEAFKQNSSLTNIQVLPSGLSGVRKVVDVIFTYTNRATDVDEKFFVRVDVTEEFPFLVTKLSPYYNR